MDANQSEQHFYISSKMPTTTMIPSAQYPCTVNIGSNKPPTNYTIVPNIMTASNNLAVGTFNNKYSNTISVDNSYNKFAQTTVSSNYNQFMAQNNNDAAQDYKLLLANNNNFKNKKVYNKRSCPDSKSNDTGSNDNITVAPNRLTILVQEVLPAQLPDNHLSAGLIPSNSSIKAQPNPPIISNPEVLSLTSSISDTCNNDTRITVANTNSTSNMSKPRDTIMEVIQEVLSKAISNDAHDDVFLSVIKARENGSIQDSLDFENSVTNPTPTATVNSDVNHFSQQQQMDYSHSQIMYSKSNTTPNNMLSIANLPNQNYNMSNYKAQISQKSNVMDTQYISSQSPKSNINTNNNKRRNNSNTQKSGVVVKKQKLSDSPTFPFDKQSLLMQQQRQQQNMVSKIGVPSFRKLVHEPKLTNNNLPDLLPVGTNSGYKGRLKYCHNLTQLQDNCVKYRRLPFALSQPNPIHCSSSFVPTDQDTFHNNFILQNLNAIVPEGALLTSKETDDYIDCIIAPSPTNSDSDCMKNILNTDQTSSVSLEMLRPPKRTQSPQLSVFHSPNKHNYLKLEPMTDSLQYRKSDPQSLLKSNGISRIQISHQSSLSPPSNQSTAQIDSETGEVVNKIQESKTRDKLLVTFTLNPLDDVEKSVKSITQMLGIDYSSVGYKVTTSGGEISIDKSSIVDSKFKSELGILPREITDRYATSVIMNPSTNTPSSISSSHYIENTNTNSMRINQPLYPETIYKSTSLISKSQASPTIGSSSATKCSNCDKVLTDTNQQITNSKSLYSKFCDETCQVEFNPNDDDNTPINNKPNEQLKEQFVFIGEDLKEKSVIVQGTMSKLKQLTKRYGNGLMDKTVANALTRKKSSPTTKMPSLKLFKGSKYYTYYNSQRPVVQFQPPVITEIQFNKLALNSSSILRNKILKDRRRCTLCHQFGDEPDDEAGRLICYDIDEWLHVGCAVWLNDTFEMQSGALKDVKDSLEAAKSVTCSSCGKSGASVSCFYSRCCNKYHVACALSSGCLFYADRAILCESHINKDYGQPLSSLMIDRRVFIYRDEIEQLQSAVNDEDRRFAMRIGSLIVYSVGQLFNYQIQSGNFHNLNYVYPVGFRSSRINWSCRLANSRSVYICEIILDPKDKSRPLFRVTAQDDNLDNLIFESDTCCGAWQEILSKCSELRKSNGSINLFPEHIKGEDLYGLTDPYILRIIESLPGFNCVHDYAFKFGKIQLLSEMPLPINPTGCVRTESYVKLAKNLQYPLKSLIHQSPNFIKHLTNATVKLESSQFSRNALMNKCQQYRKLKTETRLNVVLRRSKVEGLGLFAAKDIEKGTMIIEYIGQLIRNEVANKREKLYQQNKQGIYMFRLNSDTVIDATMTGDLARYINHSCNPNCYTEHLEFDRESHIVIISNRKIDKGEELSYDYKFDFDDDDKGEKIPCLCGARNCRRWMN